VIEKMAAFLPGRSPLDVAFMVNDLRQRPGESFPSPRELKYRSPKGGFRFSIFEDLLAYVSSATKVVLVNVRTGQTESFAVADVISVAVVNANCAFALTFWGCIWICGFGRGCVEVIDGLSGSVSLRVIRSMDPQFATATGKSVVYGTEFEQTVLEFDSRIVNVELADELYVATEREITVVFDAVPKFTLQFEEPIESFRVRGGSVVVWRANTLSLVDPKSGSMDLTLDFAVSNCLTAPGSHFFVVSGQEDVVVVDDRYPSAVYANLARKAGPCLAAWMREANVVAVADAQDVRLYELEGKELQRYAHTPGAVSDLQATGDLVIAQLPQELWLLQTGTQDVKLDDLL
jgi:hypothetical protein